MFQLLLFIAIISLIVFLFTYRKIENSNLATTIGIIILVLLTSLFFYISPSNNTTRVLTKEEIDKIIYDRVMDTTENKIFVAEGDNVCRTETIDEFNKIIVTNLGIYRVHYPFFKGENIRVEPSYLYRGSYSRAYAEVEDSEKAVSKAINALYREKLLEILNIDYSKYANKTSN